MANKLLPTCIALGLVSIAINASSKTIGYKIEVDSDIVEQAVNALDDDELYERTNLVIKPQMSLRYNSKRISAFWRGTHNYIRRELDELSVENNYTEYNYNVRLGIIDELLNLNASGGLQYQNRSSSSFLVDDFLLNAEQLAKSRSNRISLLWRAPEQKYLGTEASASYAKTESDGSAASSGLPSLNNDTISLNGRMYSGDYFERVNLDISGQYSETERQVRGNYATRQARASFTLNLIDRLGITLVGNHEANQVQSPDNVFSNLQDFNTFGAGLVWQESSRQRIAITYNRGDNRSIEEDEDNDGFVGLDLDWQFTPRTALSANYSRRFYGESGDFSFSHQLKKLRTQVRYSESVTSYSRLISSPENLGVFVCSNGVRELGSCFQPSSLNYQLGIDQEFVQFSDVNSEIDDNLILRKSFSWQLGTELSRIKVSLNGRYALNDYLEQDRTSRTYSVGNAFSYDTGPKSKIKLNLDYAVTDDRLLTEKGNATVATASVSFERKIGRHFSLDIGFRYVERELEGRVLGNIGSAGIGGNVRDRRINAGIKYSFDGN